ncbi:MAG: hypothetical protein PHC61_18550 [Chitinivibrionales bacterium]|nr:hypothetical protein [Chitinivibrionales bacterium]
MNIYVGNLPFKATDEEIKQLFEAHGTVASAVIIKDKFSQASKGFGFVDMPDAAQAQTAIAALNGKDFNGRPLRVNEARPKEDRAPRTGGHSHEGGM